MNNQQTLNTSKAEVRVDRTRRWEYAPLQCAVHFWADSGMFARGSEW